MTELKNSSIELSELAGLIKDFPAKYSPSQAAQALNVVLTRTLILEERFTNTNAEMLQPIDLVFNTPMARIIHEYLFKDILSNAGKFRSKLDPNRGIIGFGGVNRNEAQ